MKMIYKTATIPENDAGKRLDSTLAQLFSEYSRTQLKKWLLQGCIRLNQQVATAKTKIKGGEAVTLTATEEAQGEWEAEALPLSIVYEDDDLLVIDKPIGLVVHPGAGTPKGTLLNALLHHAPALKLLPRAGILHRLDKNTSGLLVVAKTAEALKNLAHQLKKRTMSREYQAIVYGKLISGGIINAPIGRHYKERKRMAVTETGKTAVTHYRIAEKYKYHTRLHLRLETGRTHQIRVHLAHIRHPIVGDPVYGGRIRVNKGQSKESLLAIHHFKRQALHAVALGFTHPKTGKVLQFESELPQDIKQLITLLRKE